MAGRMDVVLKLNTEQYHEAIARGLSHLDLLRSKSMNFGQQEKTYPASIIQKAIEYTRDSRSHVDLERVMDLLVGLQPWQVLIHASEIASVHLNKEIKIVNGTSGKMTDYRDSRGRPDDCIWIVIGGKMVSLRSWDDVIVYMSEE